MTAQQKQWFEELIADREENARALEKPSMRGIKRSVVEKYTDQAHFIYELLQNADDVKATMALFRLTKEGLYFIHNGLISFSISDPKLEGERRYGGLGHINAITSIANSNKMEASIGKFGIGFKAVFQYTETPYIYDDNFKFKIERFIVPVKLEKDLDIRKKNETAFYFPFNKQGMSAEQAYREILEKLEKLIYPTLFLSNIKEIKWQINDNKIGLYTQKVTNKIEKNNLICDTVEIYSEKGSGYSVENLYLFTRYTVTNHSYSVGFFIKDGKLLPKSLKAFCFFPTRESTNLQFILNAPFLLTDSREGINRSEVYNKQLVISLADLAADSLLVLRDLNLIDDDIFNIIPYKTPSEDDFFANFYTKIKEVFETEALLPAKGGGYVKKDNAHWASVSKLTDLFSNEQLTAIWGNKDNSKWVFTSKGRDELQRTNKDLVEYIDDITSVWLHEDDLLYGLPHNDIYNGITNIFIEKQTYTWLILFYQWLLDTEKRREKAKNKPFFINQHGKAVPIYDSSNELRLFLPDNYGNNYHTINTVLFKETESLLSLDVSHKKSTSKHEGEISQTSRAKEFFEKFGIREHTVADEIKETIESFHWSHTDKKQFFAKLFKYFKNECPQDKIDAFINQVENLPFIEYYTLSGQSGFSIGKNLVYPTEQLLRFYHKRPDTRFINIDKLYETYSRDRVLLDIFLKKLGVTDKDPDTKDEIFNIILPSYIETEQLDIKLEANHISHLEKILKYIRKCPNEELYNLYNAVRKSFLLFYTSSDAPDTFLWSRPEELYYPSTDLKSYFHLQSDRKFLALSYYEEKLSDEKDKQMLKEFFEKMGVKFTVSVIKRYYQGQFIIYQDFNRSYCRTYNGFEKNIFVDGLEAALDNISLASSIYIWNILVIPNKECLYGKVEYSRSKIYANSTIYEIFSEKFGKLLYEKKWLYTKSGSLVAPSDIYFTELVDGYNYDSIVEHSLQLKTSAPISNKQYLYDRVSKFMDLGYTLEDIEALIVKDQTKKQNFSASNNQEKRAIPQLNRVIEDLDSLQLEFQARGTNIQKEKVQESYNISEEDFDEESLLAEGVEFLKKQLEVKKNRIRLIEEVNSSIKYSYKWFISYLELLTTYSEKQNTTLQKSISFQEIKSIKSDNKYFLLRGASSYISPEIESAEDFNIAIVFKSGKKENIKVEGVSKRGQDLLVYCPQGVAMSILEKIESVFRVEILFTPVIDLLDRLFKAFSNPNYINEWEDIKEVMPPLQYIYGPPGTGKTTRLCKGIKKALANKSDAKILILTPTNKASDVICKKLLEDGSTSVVRLSRPTDPDLEEKGIYCDTLDTDTLVNIQVVASTIHRFPYFDVQGEGFMFQYKWDYVIFDESSMIGLSYITFAIMSISNFYNDIKFIVAGDPKQIPPVIDVNDQELESLDFQDENIYKMMSLESFRVEEQDIRPIDSIRNLKIQYRSLPQIGQLFSDLSYASLLEHNRADSDDEYRRLPEAMQSIIPSNITFIDVPLEKSNSVFKISKLLHSSYHVYTTILVAEIIKYFSTLNITEVWTVGVIAPYKAQAVILNKLLASYVTSHNIKICADTVHGFQGDECDIIFFVCNPNSYVYSDNKKSLLSKEYIYNVAISRAKDYLVVLYPHSKIKNNIFINRICDSFENNFGKIKSVASQEIEKTLFNKENYIENNAYVSGHDNVNVFAESAMTYFIKANDTAIDIQLKGR